MSTTFEQAMGRLLQAVETEFGVPATGWHINRGESEDYIRGFNAGYDAAQSSPNEDPGVMAPEDEPWRSAYLRGYGHGQDCFFEQESDDGEDDFDEDACPKCERPNCTWDGGICFCDHCGYIGS